MKRVQYHRYGGPEVLRLEEFALAAPGRGQIRVRVRAAAVNPMDWKIRSGEMKMMTGRKFPRGLGHDFAGVVEAVGPNVTRFKVGDEVFGATGLKEAGTFAEALVTEDKTVFLKPRSLSFEEAAALPIVSAAAWTALIDKAKLQAGQRVFITGCLGGAGRVAVQIAKMRGAEIAGSCSASRRDEALALGVREIVDYRTFDANAYRGCFDVVFDTHGSLSLRCGVMLKRGGVALHLVPTPLKMIWSMLSPRHYTIFTQVTPQSLAGIAEAVEEGKLTPKIGRTVPLSEAIPAIIELEKTSLPSGKLVIEVHP
jgi:NADPH:quinone reductase-like Zn-dependent oxidoreductase